MALDDGRVEKNISQIDKITKGIQDQVMSLRLLPLRYVFSKMSRVVRDVAKSSRKDVVFNVTGEHTEVDKSILDALGDPLTHLLRNCIDHGIESVEERRSSGKPETGKVSINAHHQGGNVVIEVSDDGRGLSREKVYEKAVERGLIDKNAEPGDHDLYGLIFEPGFSTAEEVTTISGRGVGLDVVKKDVERLRGKIDLMTVPSVGTTFTLRFPLTTASIEGMLVKVGRERYIVPTLSIETSFRPVTADITNVAEQGEVVKVRGGLYPVVRIHSLFDVKGATTGIEESILILVEADGKRCCIMVDDILGHQHVVIKSLDETMASVEGVSGCSILGDGKVGLILDASGLMSKAFA